MRDFNKVVLTGRLTRDPEIKYLTDGKPVCNLSIAVNDDYKEKKRVSYLDVAIFGNQATSCEQYLSKGRWILVEGKLQQRRWEKDGNKQSKVEIIASGITFLDSKSTGEGATNDVVNSDDIPF
jgi:single-strand DNA-binding protein